mgnify:CR=1 FL=1
MASNNFRVDVEGIESLNKMLKKIGDEQRGIFKKKALRAILYDGAKEIAEEVRSRTPVGPTGNLRRSVKAKQFDILPTHGPAAFAAIDRKIAPHAHLIEFGVPKRNIDAKHFFRNGVQASVGKVTRLIRRKAKQRLKFRKGATI